MPTPLIYTANRDNPWNWAARASQLQFSAHRSEGRVPGLAYIVSEARAQACTQAQACWHSFHTSRRSALASEHFSEGKFEAYHKAQQTQLFFHATKPVHCGTPASTVSQSLHRHGTWMLHLQSKALSKGSCVVSLHMLTHLTQAPSRRVTLAVTELGVPQVGPFSCSPLGWSFSPQQEREETSTFSITYPRDTK